MKLRALIFEDEALNAERLIRLIGSYDREIEIEGVVSTVAEGIRRFAEHAPPDLVFMDIRLSDGNCFEIFDEVRVDAPIIFTTAYDEFALKAFKLNSVDYLLKPFSFADLSAALDKFTRLSGAHKHHSESLENLHESFKKSYKSRFLIKIGDRLVIVNAADAARFKYSDDATSVVTKSGAEYVTDFSLDKLEEMLDPAEFIRVNRKFVVAISTIKRISTYFNGRLILELNPPEREDVIVSRDRVKTFKERLEGIQ